MACHHLSCTDCIKAYSLDSPDNAGLCPSCRHRAPDGQTYYQELAGLHQQMLDCLGRIAALDQQEDEEEEE